MKIRILDFVALLVLVCGASGRNLQNTLPKKDVHFFYYIWYGNPEWDGSYRHWVNIFNSKSSF